MGTAETGLDNGTINGGAGRHHYSQGSAGAGLSATSGLATGIASIAYAAGDVIVVLQVVLRLWVALSTLAQVQPMV